MKIRSRYQGQVKLVDVDYLPGAEPTEFFKQVVAARTDIPNESNFKFLVKCPGAGKPQPIHSAEALASIMETKDRNKPLVVLIRCPSRKAAGKEGPSGRIRVRSNVGGKPHQAFETSLETGSAGLENLLHQCNIHLPPEKIAGCPVLRFKDPQTSKMTSIQNSDMLNSTLKQVDQSGNWPLRLLYADHRAPESANEVAGSGQRGADNQLRVRTMLKGEAKAFTVDNFTEDTDLEDFLDDIWERRGLTRNGRKTFVKTWGEGGLLKVTQAQDIVDAIQSKPDGKPLRLVLRPNSTTPNQNNMEVQ